MYVQNIVLQILVTLTFPSGHPKKQSSLIFQYGEGGLGEGSSFFLCRSETDLGQKSQKSRDCVTQLWSGQIDLKYVHG
jgi:hypothetical protein